MTRSLNLVLVNMVILKVVELDLNALGDETVTYTRHRPSQQKLACDEAAAVLLPPH